MNCKYFKEFLFCVIVAIILFFLYCYSFDYCVKKDFKPRHYEHTTTLHIDSLTKVVKSDTLDMAKFVARVDSIAKETSNICNRYQEDVNLMIYKSTHWMTFWLGIFTVFAGLVGLFQYFRNRRYNDDFEKMKGETDAFKEKLEKDAKENLKEYKGMLTQLIETYKENLDNKVDAKFVGSNEKFAELDKQILSLSRDIRKSENENRISSLMTCISSFPDPAMFNSTPKRKLYIQFYLKKLNQEFCEYTKVVKQIKKEDLTEDDYSRLSLALSSLKYVVVRTQSAFSGYHQNVTFSKLKDSINELLINIVEQGTVDDDFGNQLDSINDVFKRMIHSIEVSE